MSNEVYVILKSNKSKIVIHQVICTDNVELVETLLGKVVCEPNEVATYIRTPIHTVIND